MKSIRKFIHNNPLISALIILFLELTIYFSVKYISITKDVLLSDTIKEVLFAVSILFFVYIIAGRSEVKFSTKGLKFTLKKSWWAYTIHIVIGIFTLIQFNWTFESFIGNPYLILVLTAIYTIAIGIFEEFLMRGVLFNSLLVHNGDSYIGIFRAMIISSLIFGVLHIGPSFVNNFPNFTLNDVLMMIGRILQTGSLGFLFAAIYLRDHNLWTVAIIHGIIDFVLMLPENLYTGIEETVDSSNWFQYYILLVLYIPFIITAIKIVKNTTLPQYGFFRENWYPLAIETDRKRRQS